MVFNKILTLFAGVFMVSDCIQGYHLQTSHEVTQTGQTHHGNNHIIDYHAHPRYEFNYAVHDPHTGDVKNQWETRNGDQVRGSYTVHDPDGTIRTVDYTSDKDTGFQAVVRRVGKAYHPKTVIAQHTGKLGGHSTTGGHFLQGQVEGHGVPVAEMMTETQPEVIQQQVVEEQNSLRKVQTTQLSKGVKQQEETEQGEVVGYGRKEDSVSQLTDEQYQNDDGSAYYLPFQYRSH